MDCNGTSEGFCFFGDVHGNGCPSTLGSCAGNSVYDCLHIIEKGFEEKTDGQDFTSAMGQLLELLIFSSREDLKGKSEVLLGATRSVLQEIRRTWSDCDDERLIGIRLGLIVEHRLLRIISGIDRELDLKKIKRELDDLMEMRGRTDHPLSYLSYRICSIGGADLFDVYYAAMSETSIDVKHEAENEIDSMYYGGEALTDTSPRAFFIGEEKFSAKNFSRQHVIDYDLIAKMGPVDPSETSISPAELFENRDSSSPKQVRSVLITGAAAAGKSVLASHYATVWAMNEERVRSAFYLPLDDTESDILRSSQDLTEELLINKIAASCLSRLEEQTDIKSTIDFVRVELQNPSTLLVIDGTDVADEQIKPLLDLALSPEAKYRLLLVSRADSYPGILVDRKVICNGLSTSGVQEYLNRAFDDKARQEFMKDVAWIDDAKEFIRNPLSLSVFILLWKKSKTRKEVTWDTLSVYSSLLVALWTRFALGTSVSRTYKEMASVLENLVESISIDSTIIEQSVLDKTTNAVASDLIKSGLLVKSGTGFTLPHELLFCYFAGRVLNKQHLKKDECDDHTDPVLEVMDSLRMEKLLSQMNQKVVDILTGKRNDLVELNSFVKQLKKVGGDSDLSLKIVNFAVMESYACLANYHRNPQIRDEALGILDEKVSKWQNNSKDQDPVPVKAAAIAFRWMLHQSQGAQESGAADGFYRIVCQLQQRSGYPLDQIDSGTDPLTSRFSGCFLRRDRKVGSRYRNTSLKSVLQDFDWRTQRDPGFQSCRRLSLEESVPVPCGKIQQSSSSGGEDLGLTTLSPFHCRPTGGKSLHRNLESSSGGQMDTEIVCVFENASNGLEFSAGERESLNDFLCRMIRSKFGESFQTETLRAYLIRKDYMKLLNLEFTLEQNGICANDGVSLCFGEACRLGSGSDIGAATCRDENGRDAPEGRDQTSLGRETRLKEEISRLSLSFEVLAIDNAPDGGNSNSAMIPDIYTLVFHKEYYLKISVSMPAHLQPVLVPKMAKIWTRKGRTVPLSPCDVRANDAGYEAQVRIDHKTMAQVGLGLGEFSVGWSEDSSLTIGLGLEFRNCGQCGVHWVWGMLRVRLIEPDLRVLRIFSENLSSVSGSVRRNPIIKSVSRMFAGWK